MILADENLPESLVAALQAAGHDVVRMSDIDPGAPDEEVLAHAVRRSAIVVTQDKDFGELLVARGLAHSGVVLVRLRGMSFADKAARVVALFEERGEEALAEALTVISNRGARERR